jgi:hypothetical protein
MPLWLNLPLDGMLGEIVSPAHALLAYLDPGMGSYALQMILASLFGGMFSLRQSWAEIKLWLSSRSAVSSKSTEIATQELPRADRRPPIVKQGIHGHSTLEIR